jgi:hypothetical protein
MNETQVRQRLLDDGYDNDEVEAMLDDMASDWVDNKREELL